MFLPLAVAWLRSAARLTAVAQPPQPVVARVVSRASSNEEHARIAPTVTPAQLQISASSGSWFKGAERAEMSASSRSPGSRGPRTVCRS